MLATDSKDGVHKALMLHRQLEKDVLKCVVGLSFHRQNVAEVVDVVLPKDLVFGSLDTMEERLHGDDRKTLVSYALYRIIKCMFIVKGDATYLLLPFPCRSSTPASRCSPRRPQHSCHSSCLQAIRESEVPTKRNERDKRTARLSLITLLLPFSTCDAAGLGATLGDLAGVGYG